MPCLRCPWTKWMPAEQVHIRLATMPTFAKNLCTPYLRLRGLYGSTLRLMIWGAEKKPKRLLWGKINFFPIYFLSLPPPRSSIIDPIEKGYIIQKCGASCDALQSWANQIPGIRLNKYKGEQSLMHVHVLIVLIMYFTSDNATMSTAQYFINLSTSTCAF